MCHMVACIAADNAASGVYEVGKMPHAVAQVYLVLRAHLQPEDVAVYERVPHAFAHVEWATHLLCNLLALFASYRYSSPPSRHILGNISYSPQPTIRTSGRRCPRLSHSYEPRARTSGL